MDWVKQFIILSIFSVFPSVVARDTIFVADLKGKKIWKAPLETLEFEEIPVQKVNNPVAVDYDPVDHKLYWTDIAFKAIIRANLDGTQEEVVVPYLSVPDGLSIDVIMRHLYWTDTGTDTIERANLNGTDRVIITRENHDQPRAIVVDSQGGLMYWTDWGNNSKIERANLDGSDRVVLVDTGLLLPNGLAIDFEGNRMYWCDAGNNKIESADLDGQNRVTLATFIPILLGVDLHPFDIGIYNDDLYWSDWRVRQLLKMNKFVGLSAVGVGPGVFERAGGLHIFKDEVDECSSNPCNAGECIDEINFYSCNCTATGYEGDNCEINIDECNSSPCSSGGRCVDLDNGYKCECLAGYTGNRCQEDIDECSCFPCANGGTCTNLVNKFECRCNPDYDGPTCNIPNQPDSIIPPDPPKCVYPGDIDNGHVIQENPGDTLVPGSSLEFLCFDEYKLIGVEIVYCQSDRTWSDKNPTCVADSEESFVSSSVVYGGGAGGVLLIVILLIILIVVCFMKRRSKSELPNPVVYYTGNGLQAPKDTEDTGEYSTSIAGSIHYNQGPTRGTGYDRPAMPMPRVSTESNHFYDAINIGEGAVGGAGRHPPSYLSVIGDKIRESEGGEVNNGYISVQNDTVTEMNNTYLYTKTNEVKTPIYDIPKPAKHD